MTLRHLLLRNLVYHWRGNLAVGLGVVVGTAVLTGALLVGDSLRGSLKDLTLKQLGWVDHSLVGNRFIRAELADKLDTEKGCPAILLQGAASTEQRRAGRVVILGVDERFWPDYTAPLDQPFTHHAFWHPADPADTDASGVVLNATLARDLGINVGDRIALHLQKASDVPRESLLGRRGAGDVLDTLQLTVHAIISDDSPMAEFSLSPSPDAPRNAFVPLTLLQHHLDVKGRANALLVRGPRTNLQNRLAAHLDLDDWGLVTRTPQDRAHDLVRKLDPHSTDGSLPRARWTGHVPEELAKWAHAWPEGRLRSNQIVAYYLQHRGYLSLESRQMFLEDVVVKAARRACRESGLICSPSLIYLADTISDGKHEVPYSVVAAVEFGLPAPLGPFENSGEEPPRDDEIVLADWPESPLQAKRGDKIRLWYYQLDRHGSLEKKSSIFEVRDKIPMTGAADDPDLTPEFRGITDKLDIRNWENPPFPYDNRRITAADEHYWNRYRTTPKAYITLKKGIELWGSRYGNFTSIRMVSEKGGDLNTAFAAFRAFDKSLLANLRPEDGGLVFEDVRERGLRASAGGTDFDGLFLGFSFFLIVAALLLVGLLFRLNMDRRAAEIGLLFASGYRRLKVVLLLLAEGTIVAAVGAAVGCLAALLYGWLLLALLRAWWPGSLDRSFLTLHASATSFAIGYGASLLISVLTIAVAVWMLARVSPRALLLGETSEERDPVRQTKPPRWSLWIAAGSAIIALMLGAIGWFVRDHAMRAGTFFGSGFLLQIAALAGVWAWMRRSRHGTVTGHGLPALTRLGARNGARNPLRSLLTAGLLAAAAFLIVAVESFRRQTDADYLNKDSGSGGFALLAESDVPMFQDLNTDKGRDEILEQYQRLLQQRGHETKAGRKHQIAQVVAAQAIASSGVGIPLWPQALVALKVATVDAFALETKEALDTARTELEGVQFYPFRTRGGDDASCLNLYQPRRPRLLGVSTDLIFRGGFRFAAVESPEGKERRNPWVLLNRTGGDAIPVIGEANTVTWMLKSKLGGELEVPNERGETVKLRIVGLLQDSVFQSGLLMSESNFLKLYPGQEGYNLFLIDTRDQPPAAIRDLLGTTLAERGFEVTPTAERLESYLAVENTYLSTFQALGGLGLLLGALGLGVVLLRGVWERRGELALLRALGYRQRALGWLVLAENGFLLLLGLGVGTVAALLAVAPHLLGGEGAIPWPRLLAMLGLVLLVGLMSGAAALARTLSAPLVPALRRE
jgi:ABC-type antimicrobial peptide transport system permease subunit